MPIAMETAEVISGNLAYVAAFAGAVAGVIDGRRLHGQIAEQRQTLVSHIGEADARDLIDPSINIAPNTGSSRDWRSPVVGALALVYGLTGYAAGEAFKGANTTPQVPPSIEYVAEMSGTMGSPADEKSPLSKVLNTGRLLAKRNEDGKVVIEAIVAKSGDHSPVEIDKLAGVEALGGGPIEDAVDAAFGAVRTQRAFVGEGGKANTAILVATNGRGIGSVKRVIAEANSPKTRTPVYVYNVGEETSSTRQNNLETIARETGGKYLQNVDDRDIDAIVDELEATSINGAEDGNGSGGKIFALLAVAGAIGFRRKAASKLPLQYHGNSSI